MGLELDPGHALVLLVDERAHDLGVLGAAVLVDEPLLALVHAVPDPAGGDLEPVDLLRVELDLERQRVADADVLRDLGLAGGAAEVDEHPARGKGRRRRDGRRAFQLPSMQMTQLID